MYLSRGPFRYSTEKSDIKYKQSGRDTALFFIPCGLEASLPLVLESSTRMISLRRCGGDLLSTLCTERSSVDQTSSTKQKITLVDGRSSWIRLCAQLEEDEKKKRKTRQLRGETRRGRNGQREDEAHVSGLVSGTARSTGIWSLR